MGGIDAASCGVATASRCTSHPRTIVARDTEFSITESLGVIIRTANARAIIRHDGSRTVAPEADALAQGVGFYSGGRGLAWLPRNSCRFRGARRAAHGFAPSFSLRICIIRPTRDSRFGFCVVSPTSTLRFVSGSPHEHVMHS